MILCVYYTCCQAFWAGWLCPRAWLTWIVQGSRNRDQQWPVRAEGRVHSPQELFLPIDQLVVSICWHRHHMRKKVEAMLLPCLSCLRIYIAAMPVSMPVTPTFDWQKHSSVSPWSILASGEKEIGHPWLCHRATSNGDWFTCTIMYL